MLSFLNSILEPKVVSHPDGKLEKTEINHLFVLQFEDLKVFGEKMFKSFTPINLTLLSVPIHRSEAKEWISRVRGKLREDDLTTVVPSPVWRKLQREKWSSFNRQDGSVCIWDTIEFFPESVEMETTFWFNFKGYFELCDPFWIWSNNWKVLLCVSVCSLGRILT